MDASRRHSLTVGLTFGVMGLLISLTWAVGQLISLPHGDQPVPLWIGIVVTTVVSAIVGPIAWTLIVDKVARWSTPARGAIAGAVTIWGAPPVIAPVVNLVAHAGTYPLSVEVLLEALMLALFMGTVGFFFVSVFFLPFGILTGYLLGRRLAKNPGPVPVVHRIA